MYNSIYPVNINYRKTNPYRAQGSSYDAKNQDSNLNNSSSKTDSYIPASNRINISQILMDFRNTILAINAPADVQDEVNIYLNLVEKESKKAEPSKDIIFSNLKNASKISDSFITSALGKNSNVVEGWISTIFKQNIDLKSNPDDINPDFLLKFPNAPAENSRITVSENVPPVFHQEETASANTVVPLEEMSETPISVKEEAENPEKIIEVQASVDEAQTENIFTNNSESNSKSAFGAYNDEDSRAKVLYLQAKKMVKNESDSQDAINILNEALGYLSEESNPNIRAAIHFERGKIFDLYDYVDYALRDYYEASKADDLNLKANAFYKTGSLYDEFKQFDPALDSYLSSVAYSGEADNLSAQSRVLSKISQMYAKVFDSDSAHEYADLAIDTAVDSGDSEAIAKTYSAIAQNYQYLGDNKKALENYKNALMEFSQRKESYDEMAYNYSQAAIIMRELGNEAKAEKLQAKANQYYQKAQLLQGEQELAG